MARQTGIIKLKGTIGGVSFYKTRDGHLAREKGGVDRNRIMNDPAFQRTRENGSEFALRALLINASDFRMVSRLTKEMVKVLQEDQVSERGLRNVLDGELELLQGFEFNIAGKLGTTIYAPFTSAINRVTGELNVDLASFVPINMINAPSGSTHFRIVSAGAEIDFEEGTFVSAESGTAILPYDSTATAAINLLNAVTAASTKPLFLALGIEFYQEINGTMYSLKNGSYNALALVRIDGGV
jgi:hypothetical protein